MPEGVNQSKSTPTVSAKPRHPPSITAAPIVSERTRSIAQITHLRIQLLTLNVVPRLAPRAVISSSVNNCNAPASRIRFCQRNSLSPTVINAIAKPVHIRFIVSLLLQLLQLLQVSSKVANKAPRVASGIIPNATRINHEWRGRMEVFARGGRWARNV